MEWEPRKEVILWQGERGIHFSPWKFELMTRRGKGEQSATVTLSNLFILAPFGDIQSRNINRVTLAATLSVRFHLSPARTDSLLLTCIVSIFPRIIIIIEEGTIVVVAEDIPDTWSTKLYLEITTF